MFNKILSTTATRFLATIISFLIVVMNSRTIGPEGIGTIGIILLDVSILTTFSNIFGGPSLVYFTPRRQLKSLFIISFFSSVIGALAVVFIYGLTEVFYFDSSILIPDGFFIHILFMTFIQTFLSNNLNILLGKEKIYIHNLLSIFQVFVLFISLSVLYFYQGGLTINSWLIAWYLSQFLPLLISLYLIFRLLKISGGAYLLDFKLIKEISRFGLLLQMASIVQLLNYRLPYYLLNKFFPATTQLGVFTVGTQLSEGVLIIGKSVSMVQYSKISNSIDISKNGKLSVQLLKFSLLTSVLIIVILLIFPEDFYVFLFSFQVFSSIKDIVFWLSPGIIAVTANMIFSHYLSGIGNPQINLRVSIIGLIVIIVAGIPLISSFGFIGAAISTSLSYIISSILSFYYFKKYSKIKYTDLVFNKEDYFFVINLLRNLKKSIRN